MSQGQKDQPRPQRRPAHHPRVPRNPPQSWFETASSQVIGHPDFKWKMFRPWVRASKLRNNWEEWDIRDIVKEERTDAQDLQEMPKPSKRMFSFEFELNQDIRPSQIDFEQLLGYTSHPADYDDEFFETHFKNLYVKTVEFVTKWFDCNVDFTQIPDSQYVWESNLTPQFKEYASLVATEDRTRGGWPIILNNPSQRKWLIVGILAQIMDKKIFTELLFGADEFIKSELERDDSVWIEQEGYSRKANRANIARYGLKDNLVPRDFWINVDELAAKTTKIFLPLLNVMKVVRPNVGEPYELKYFLQELHYILGYAGIFQVCTAVSPDVFQIISAAPGARMDFSVESQADMQLYRESLEYHTARERRWEQRALAAMRGENYDLAPNEQFAIPRNEQEFATMQNRRQRGAKVKFAVFPKVTRYIPENKGMGLPKQYALDEENPLWDEQKADVEGQTVVDISNCIVVYYQGLINPSRSQVEAHNLDAHLQSLGEYSNGAFWWGLEASWGLSKLLFAAALRLFGLLPLYAIVGSLYVGSGYALGLIQQYPAYLLAAVAFCSWLIKSLFERNRIPQAVIFFLLPFLYIGIGGALGDPMTPTNGTWMTHLKEGLTNVFSTTGDVSAI
ncbi:hypothetical protein F4818DRAFT_454309 [Hypoxylon cercidicola]|nr:hypothetical protein F4818DRAFT_454309 [Hypoxylon cercidicola]